MAVDLKTMSRSELLELRDEVDKEIVQAAERERTSALKAAEDASAKYGFSLDELTGEGRKRKMRGKRSKSEAKYRNPENPIQTWSGLGRKPQWYHDAMAKGMLPEQLEL